MSKNNNAITLISLVITIVVLLILSAAIINLSIEDFTAFRRAKETRQVYINAQNAEQYKINEIKNEKVLRGISNELFSEKGSPSKIHTLSYDGNGGIGLPTKIVKYSSEFTVGNKVPIKEGYVFLGWNTQKDGTGTRYIPGSNITISEDTILYAQWGTLFDATNDYQIGETITLTSDLNYECTTNGAYKLIHFKDNSTIDFNGKTVYVDNSAVKNGNINFMGNNLTIKNGYYSVVPDTGGRTYLQIWGYDGADLDELMENVTVENMTINGGFNLYNAKNVVFRNNNITAKKYYAIFANPDNVTVTIESGTYSTTSASTALFAYYKTNPDNGFKIYGGTFKTNGKPLFLGGSNYKPGIIYGGTFDCDVSSYVADGYTCYNNGNSTYTVTRNS